MTHTCFTWWVYENPCWIICVKIIIFNLMKKSWGVNCILVDAPGQFWCIPEGMLWYIIINHETVTEATWLSHICQGGNWRQPIMDEDRWFLKQSTDFMVSSLNYFVKYHVRNVLNNREEMMSAFEFKMVFENLLFCAIWFLTQHIIMIPCVCDACFHLLSLWPCIIDMFLLTIAICS